MYKSTRSSALIIGAIFLVIGSVGPWLSVAGLVTMGPTDSYDLCLVIFGVIGLVIASAMAKWHMNIAAVFGGLVVLAESLRVLIKMNNLDDSYLIQPGWGLYLSMGTSLFLIAVPWVTRNKEN